MSRTNPSYSCRRHGCPGSCTSTPASTIRSALPASLLVLVHGLLQALQARQHVRHGQRPADTGCSRPTAGSCRRRSPASTNTGNRRPRSRAISDRSGGGLPNQLAASAAGIALLTPSNGLLEVNIRFAVSSARESSDPAPSGCSARYCQRMAARAVVHEIARAALQGLDVADVGAAPARAPSRRPPARARLPPASSATRDQ